MSRICSSCGNDAGFEVSRCPNCGSDMSGQVPAGPGASATSTGSEWEKTVVEPTAPRLDAGRRPRFDRGREFYEAIDETHTGTTIGAGSPDQGMADRTIVERQGAMDSDDATVIVRSHGKRGIDGPLAYLVERSGVRAGKVHLLRRETAVGRAPESDVVLGDESVSKRHAKIRLEDGKFVYWDLASTNFSRLVGADGSRTRILEPRQLVDGDTIDLGDARVTFILVEEGGNEDA